MVEKIKCIFRRIISILPVKKNLWIFGAWRGQLYADNSKYMFEYVREKHPEINAVWITKSQELMKQLRGEGIKVYKRFSPRGMWAVARAGAAFETEGDQDISPLMNKKTLVAQLWHGDPPKKTNWTGFNDQADRKREYHWMVTSEQNKEAIQEIFGIADNHLFITGYPRNDIFVIDKPKSAVAVELEELYPDCRKILYMPTHRNFGNDTPTFSEEDMLTLDQRLREKRMVMVFKPHFHELQKYMYLESLFTNIILAHDKEKYGDVYSYAGDFDLLISDYSSIAYDYLCSGKPVVLFTYDLENFKKNDAGLHDYFETTPLGPFCNTWEEVLEESEKLLAGDKEWEQKRDVCKQIFHPFDDGLNRQRVYETVKRLLNR